MENWDINPYPSGAKAFTLKKKSFIEIWLTYHTIQPLKAYSSVAFTRVVQSSQQSILEHSHQSKKKRMDKKMCVGGFPGGAVVKNLPANAGDTVWSLAWDDPTCRGATKPVRHNYRACALEPASHNYWAHAPRARAPQREKPPQWEARALQPRVAPAHHN